MSQGEKIGNFVQYHVILELIIALKLQFNNFAVSSVPAFADDRLTICSRNQEAALSSLRQSYGAGYGKPIPGSASDLR